MLEVEDIVETSLSTRPDCIRQDYLEAFYEFSSRTGIEVIDRTWITDSELSYINGDEPRSWTRRIY